MPITEESALERGRIKPEVHFPIAKEGFIFIGAGLLLTLLAGHLWGGKVGSFWGVLTLFVTWFFRDPSRTVPEGEGLLVSPADGIIVGLENIYEDRFIKGPAVKMSIFLNIFNVHITRIPAEGQVVDIVYNAGRFLLANVPHASIENEQNTVMLETPSGKKVVLVQIAGFIARRIVCWIQRGAMMACGERFGLIRFGSRVDIIFPVDVKLYVSKGDRVWGGKTLLGKF